MARKKISEFRAKTILYKELGIPYNGVEITPDSNIDEKVSSLSDEKEYVVKVDQGVKKRGKQGLIKVKIQKSNVKSEIENLKSLGFEYFLIEEFIPHDQADEKYLSIQRVREGYDINYSDKGGVEIEDNADSILHSTLSLREIEKLAQEIPDHFDIAQHKQVRNDIQKLLDVFDTNYFSFLELNPFLYHDSKMVILDAAVEVDSAAEFFVNEAWNRDDFREYSKQKKTSEEKAIAELADKSQASFSLTVLNPDGALCMLLSGGGASIVLADEAYNQGKGAEVANYGEYSGNPNAEETYIYTKNILELLLKSQAPRKALIIAGGVANFTDIKATFKGVIQAISEYADRLRGAHIKVFVRRGGPNQKEGLKLIREFLEKEDLYGDVAGPDMVLSKVVTEALKSISQT